MLNLSVVLVSTRPVRLGEPIAQWFFETARTGDQFTVNLIDLAKVNLPVFDEPAHPRLRTYQHQHTKNWSALVDAADAFVFVTPEYNYNAPPSFVNAIDYLFHEWNYKPCGFVSYGGISAGTRAVQSAKALVTTVKMMPMTEAVNLPFAAHHVEDGKFKATDVHTKSALDMLAELHRWASALKPLRAPK